MMLALGARVVAAEPAADIAAFLNESVTLNCFAEGGRAVVVNAFVDADPTASGMRPMIKSYRAGIKPKSIILPPAKVVTADWMLLEALRQPEDVRAPMEFDLVKLDADGPEGAWLERIEELVSQGLLRVKTCVVECNGCDGELLHKLQSVHGYHIYHLDMHVDRRFLNSKGIDIYSHFKPDPRLPHFVEELYGIRAMRHLYRYRQNMTLEEWNSRPARLVRVAAPQYLLTHEPLVEYRKEHWYSTRKPSQERLAAGL